MSFHQSTQALDHLLTNYQRVGPQVLFKDHAIIE